MGHGATYTGGCVGVLTGQLVSSSAGVVMKGWRWVPHTHVSKCSAC